MCEIVLVETACRSSFLVGDICDRTFAKLADM